MRLVNFSKITHVVEYIIVSVFCFPGKKVTVRRKYSMSNSIGKIDRFRNNISGNNINLQALLAENKKDQKF